jgi:hypothetical protein
MACGPFQGAVENPAGARPSKCIIIVIIIIVIIIITIKHGKETFTCSGPRGLAGYTEAHAWETGAECRNVQISISRKQRKAPDFWKAVNGSGGV